MFQPEKVKGIIFDYGGTLDSNGLHWAEVIWSAYREAAIPVTYEAFRDAYVHGERTLGRNPIVQPGHNFHDMLLLKIRLQIDWLVENGHLDAAYAHAATDAPTQAPADRSDKDDAPAQAAAGESVIDKSAQAPAQAANETTASSKAANQTAASSQAGTRAVRRLADLSYRFARQSVDNARPLLDSLRSRYPLVLVSNFYGNIETVLKDFRLDTCFDAIVESAVVGIRKPDPAIFRLGIETMGLPAEATVVIGDSHDKDILPAASLGCQTIWLKNIGWKPYTGAETADAIVGDFREIGPLFFR